MNTQTINQGTELAARSCFTMRKQGVSRGLTVKPGDVFWVTNSMINQSQSGCVTVDRKGRGHISQGYALTHAQVTELFTIPA